MLVRDVVAAAVAAVLRKPPMEKGKAAAAMDPTRKDYGSAARSERRSPYYRAASSSTGSVSHSGERLYSVPEDVNDSLSGCDGEPSTWDNIDDGGDECSEGDEEDWENSRQDYRRAIRFYAVVPIGSTIFFLFAAFLPGLITSAPLPTAPSSMRLMLSTLLSASLWCLAHALRLPLYFILKTVLAGLVTVFTSAFCSRWRRTSSNPANACVVVLASVVHAVLIAFLQESLRLASFAMLDLHWHQLDESSSSARHPRARDAAFRQVWALALGWALAEVCAGVIQGYEQLALYADIDFTGRTPRVDLKNGDEGALEEGANNTAFDEVAVGLVRRSMPCTDWAGDDDDVKALTQADIDSALTLLANVRAREELEELYGEPYIEIPVFVPLLQRLDSLLLSLGITLLLAAAYLPKPPSDSSSSTSIPSLSLTSSSLLSIPFPASLTQPASHTYMLPVMPTFLILALLHAALGALHAPPILARAGLPAAAYASCMVGLALTFGGVGVWVGVW